jgi:hypothetical protein
MMQLQENDTLFASFSPEREESFFLSRQNRQGLADWQLPLQRMAVWFALAFIVRLALLMQPVAALDRLFVYDDTYYSLAIARNIARGVGPSVDGHMLTNGFQPLITYLQALLFRFELGPDQAIRGALLQSGFFGACAVAALGNLLMRLAGMRAAWSGAIVMALHPSIIRNDLDGLETSLGVFLSLVLLHCFLWDRQEMTRPGAFLTGLVAAAALLARIDTAFLVALLGLHAARNWRPPHTLMLGLAVAAVMLPWWLYSLHAFGHVLPESGLAVRRLAGLILSFSSSPLVAPYAALCALGRLLGDAPYFAYQNGGLGAAMLAAGVYYAVTQARSGSRRAWTLAMFTLVICVQMAFYAFYLRAEWFMPRYLGLAEAWAIAMGAHYVAGAPRLVHPRKVAGVIALIFAGPALGGELLSFAKGGVAADPGDPCPKAYRAMARQILPQVPDGAVLGALQSGALTYFAPSKLAVVNLDGVVNREAASALAANQAGAYVLRAGVTHLADWSFDVGVLRRAWGSTPLPVFRPMVRADEQTGDRVTLYQLDWHAQADGAGK